MKIDQDNFIKQIKLRNAKGLDFVVDSYSKLVFKVVRSVLNSGFHAQTVEECVNDVFWAIWINIESFDEEKGNFKYWITAIAKYKAIDYKRKLYKRSTDEYIEDYTFSDEINTESLMISKENKQELLQAINEMKEEDREIFIRRYFLFEGVENIAELFGLNRNSVDKRLSRGRKFLKDKLLVMRGEVSL